MQKQTGKIHLMLRQEGAFRLVANFYVFDVASYCRLMLVVIAGSEQCWESMENRRLGVLLCFFRSQREVQ